MPKEPWSDLWHTFLRLKMKNVSFLLLLPPNFGFDLRQYILKYFIQRSKSFSNYQVSQTLFAIIFYLPRCLLNANLYAYMAKCNNDVSKNCPIYRKETVSFLEAAIPLISTKKSPLTEKALTLGTIRLWASGFQCHAIQNRSKSKSKPFNR